MADAVMDVRDRVSALWEHTLKSRANTHKTRTDIRLRRLETACRLQDSEPTRSGVLDAQDAPKPTL